MSGSAFKTAQWLTLIAILPQLYFLFLALTDAEAAWTAPAAAFAYAGFIFSFLGGYWWGVGFTSRPDDQRILLIAVAPMLLCFVLYLPWVWGWNWPGPQLVILGIAIRAGFLVDWRMLGAPLLSPQWLKVRLLASLGLGLATAGMGLVTLSARP